MKQPLNWIYSTVNVNNRRGKVGKPVGQDETG